ncbi:hypothetical protein Mapa_013898 [Marchantia paleacea]|nr:hypothetical protein Mapa_013898 [Marchantia paleacea]
MCRALAFTFVLFALLLKDHASVHGQQPPPAVPLAAKNFFDDIENSVESLAANALLNYQNRQGLLATCNMNLRCSAFACQPVKLFSNNSQCLALPGNIVCGGTIESITSCKNATVSTSSYIRLPPQAKQFDLTCDTQMSICSQKDLDWQAFEKIYPNDGGPFNKIAWSFFGSSNGVFRIYPGLLSPRNCSPMSYDPRKRPWYKAVTGVSKEVIVLLDTGGPMASSLSLRAGTKVQVFSAAQQIVTEFLDTLNTDDIVSVYSFDNRRTTLVNKKVQISNDDVKVKGVLDPLKKAVNAITVTSNGAQANLTAAMETLVVRGGFDNSTSQVASLKIIIVITGGELADGPSVEIPLSISQAVTSQQVRTFMYELSDNSSPDTQTSGVADLKSVACTLGGSFDRVPRDNILDDPISTLRSFYSYVASLRFELDGQKPLWVPSYAAYSGIGNVMTVVYPAFDGNVLIGVAAIDLMTDEIEAEWPNAIDNWRKPADNKQSQGSPVNCSVSLSSDVAVCPGDNVADRGLCVGNALPSTDQDYTDRTCCEGGCSTTTASLNGSQKTSQSFFDKTGNKAAIMGSAACVFLLLLFCLYLSRVKIYKVCNKCIMKVPSSGPLDVAGHTGPVVVTRVVIPTSNATTSTQSLVHPTHFESSPEQSAVGSQHRTTPLSTNLHPPGQVEGKEHGPSPRPKWYDVAL